MIIYWKNIILYPLYFIFAPFIIFQNVLILLHFIPLLHSSTIYVSSPLRLEPSTLRFWAGRANHYTMASGQKNELKVNLINGFSSIIDLLMNYRIFQYFSLIIFTVLAKLSPCILGMFITQQQHTWSVNFTNSISKFCKYFEVRANYKKFQ